MITQLSITNFMRIRAVEINPDGSLVQITGRNGAGKSAVLNSIQALLGGKGGEPADPIRHGADASRLACAIDVQCPDCPGDECTACGGVGRIDKYLVEKVFENGVSKLVVTSPDGKIKHSSPQSLLNELFSDLGFDPAAFTRMKHGERDEMFRELVGLDFADIDSRISAAYDKRTDVGRAARILDAQIKDLPEVEAPDAEVKLTDLLAERDEAEAAKQKNVRREARIDVHADKVAELQQRVAELKAEVLTMVEQREAAKQKLAEVEGSAVLDVPDIPQITARIESAEETNVRVRQRQRRLEKVEQLRELRNREAGLTHDVEALRSDKRNLIEAAQMPIEGLDYGDDGITYNGVVLDQASQSEQLLVWTAIGLALNPGGVVLIREGSFLDSERLAELEQFVESRGGCVWLEKVTDGENVGIVIEDGALAGTEELQPAVA